MIYIFFFYTIWHLQSWLCCDKINFLCNSVKPKNAFKLLEPSRQELHSSRLGLEPKSITALLSLYAVDGGKFKVPAGQPRKCLDKKCCGSSFFFFFPREAGYPKSTRGASSQLAPLRRHSGPGRRDTLPRPTG